MTHVMTHEPKFASKENLQTCLDIFTKYVADKQGVSIKGSDYTNLKRLMFETMKHVEKAHDGKHVSVYDLNLIVLSTVQESYSKRPIAKPNVMNLDRDRDIYGPRQVQVNELIPQRDPYMKKPNAAPDSRMLQSADSLISRVQEERAELTRVQMPDIRVMGQQIKEEPDDINDFAKKLEILASQRSTFDKSIEQEFAAEKGLSTSGQGFPGSGQGFPVAQKGFAGSGQQGFLIEKEFREANPIDTQDMKKMYSTPVAMVQEGLQGVQGVQQGSEPALSTFRQQLLPTQPATSSHITSAPSTIMIPKYVSINSTDRDWNQTARRYEYSVTFNGMGRGGMSTSRAFRNIHSIAVGKVIIPDEIIDNAKTVYNHEFSFSYPYIILQVSEFTDVYDGTNSAIQRGFCKLIYHRSYKAPNGRGYIILKPLQYEKKVFYPAPLSSLTRMSVSLLKPNGTLLNTSADIYKILKVAYNPGFPSYYEITTDVYFDKNEFFVNDMIIIKGFALEKTGSVDQEKQLQDYINRTDGHEILQVGTANANGFYNVFYIRALGDFNKTTGSYIVTSNVITCLNTYNASINWTNRTITNGSILNASLQNTIGLTIETVVNDATSKIETLLV